MTAPEGNGDHGQHGQRRHGFLDLLHWCKRRTSALFAVLGAWLAAMWRSAGAWREHLLAAWAEARSSLWRRRWFGEYWRALVQHAGRGPARRFVFTALIACLILTGSGGLFLTNVLFPQLFGGSNVTHSPNTLDQFKNGGNVYGQNGSQTPTPHAPVTTTGSALTPAQASSSTAATTLQPVLITLDPTRYLNDGTQAVGAVSSYTASDHVLELGLADTSIDLTSAAPTGNPIPTYVPAATPTPAASPAVHAASHASAATASAHALHTALAPKASGPFTLEFTPSQVAFYTGKNGALLGGFTLRVLDGSRKELSGVKLKAPLSVRFHYQPGELAGLNTQDIRLVWTATGDEKTKTPAQSVPVSADIANTTLSASVDTLVGGQMALAASSSDASLDTSEHLTSAGNSGDAQFVVPLQTPPAAGGVAPSLQLVYGSGGPNGRHARNAPAPSTGDGWNLSLGSISYDQSYPGGGMFFLNGIGGISEPLLCCDTDKPDGTGIKYYVPHHHPNVRVQESGPNPQTSGQCFYVWTGDGMQYDMGCTADSKRSTVVGGVTYYTEWDLDKATRLAENGSTGGPGYLQQYTVKYWQDNYAQPGTGLPITRDAALQEIDYNYTNASTFTNKVLFDVHWPIPSQGSGSPQAIQYGTNYNCSDGNPPYSTFFRCDDPINRTGYSDAPLTFSTITLDRVTMQVKDSGVFKTVRRYDLSYTDNHWTECWDGNTQSPHACAGEHLLTQVQETPYQNNAAQPSRQPLVFTYTAPILNEYFDTTMTTWNGGHVFDQQTWWQYLSTFTDKQTGASGAIAWKTAYSNTNNVPGGSQPDLQNPWYCFNNSACFTGPTNPPNDRQWPRQTVYQITDTGVGAAPANPTTTFAYTLKATCGAHCVQDTWIPPNTWNSCGGIAQPPQGTMQTCLMGDWSNYYLQEFAGFETVTTTHPDGSSAWAKYYGGAGWGTNDWDIANIYRDSVRQSDVYAGSPTGQPLQESFMTYQWDLDQQNSTTCPVVAPLPNDQLFKAPYLLCFTHEIQRDTYLGGSVTTSPAVPKVSQTWTYNPAPGELNSNHFYDELLSTTTTTNDLTKDTYSPGTITGQPVFTTSYDYTYRNGEVESPTNYDYFINLPAQVRLSDNGSPTTYWRCSRTSYDGLAYAQGRSTSLKAGLPTRTDTYQACDSSGNGNASTALVTGQGYDNYGQPLVSVDADALATPADPNHQLCPKSSDPLFVVYGGVNYFTTCRQYDNTYHTYPVSDIGNLRNGSQQNVGTTTDYYYLEGLPKTVTDPNIQATQYADIVYENASGGDIYSQQTLPAQPSGWGNPSVPWTSRTYSYSFCASATGTNPCRETDTVRQYDGTNLLVTRQFYDRDGRLLETRSTGPTAGQDVVTYTTYDDLNHKVFSSQPCIVSAFTSSSVASLPQTYYRPTQVSGGSSAWVDPSVAGTNCSSATIKGTTTYYDAMGRVIASDDAAGTGVGTSGSGCLLPGGTLHHTTCATYTPVVASSTSGLPSTDSQPYMRSLSIDAKLHQSATYTDALGHVAYTQQFTGASQNPVGSGIASYAVTSATYDGAGARHTVKDAMGNTTTWTYGNTVGRLDSLNDPDRGVESYTYDPNGNVTKTVDARGGANGTICATYDGLNRQTGRQQWVNNACSATNYVTYTYDSTASGNVGLGRLTGESFTGTFAGASQTGTYSYAYDARGEVTTSALTALGNTYTTTAQYNELGSLKQQVYPGGIETVSYSYSPAGLLNSMQTSASPGQNLIDGFTYSATNGLLTGAHLGGTYAYTVSYDALLRPQDTQVRRISGNVLLYEETDGYDAAGNVHSVDTTLPTGTDHQKFCYDEQNRLTFATAQGFQSTQSCAYPNSQGSLTSALYQYTYTYDTLDRLTSGPAGSYVYTAPGHLHAASQVGAASNYTAQYDAAGNMMCRATGGTSCNSTAAALSYDNEGRLIAWQNHALNPTSTDSFLYDGEGNRVAQQSASGGVTTQSVYVGGLVDVRTVTGGPPSPGNITYYSANGSRVAMMVGGAISYLVGDRLGGSSLVLDSSGNAVASQLFSPYGGLRYSSGTMPTDYGFTGQRADATTGLDYYGARYYDPAIGQFGSADATHEDLNRYAYVHGNPTTLIDPTGNSGVPPWLIQKTLEFLLWLTIILSGRQGSPPTHLPGNTPSGEPTITTRAPPQEPPPGLDLVPQPSTEPGVQQPPENPLPEPPPGTEGPESGTGPRLPTPGRPEAPPGGIRGSQNPNLNPRRNTKTRYDEHYAIQEPLLAAYTAMQDQALIYDHTGGDAVVAATPATLSWWDVLWQTAQSGWNTVTSTPLATQNPVLFWTIVIVGVLVIILLSPVGADTDNQKGVCRRNACSV